MTVIYFSSDFYHMDAHGVMMATPWLYRNTTARPQGAARGLTRAYM